MAASEATLRKRWPDALVDRIAAGDFLLVVGAGVSRSACDRFDAHPPDWRELLVTLIDKFCTGAAKREARALVAADAFLEAAELVRARARGASKEQDFLDLIATLSDGAAGAPFMPGALHETLFRLDPRIIVTTNYDRLVERATQNGYNSQEYTSLHLASNVRTGSYVQLKLHGSVDHPENMILTRSDYSRLRRQGAEALSLVEALFLTKTALFVGYSLSDPDIHLLLENVLGGRATVPAHYLLCEKGMPVYRKDILSFSYGTSLIEFARGDFLEMHSMLSVLADMVEEQRPDSV